MAEIISNQNNVFYKINENLDKQIIAQIGELELVETNLRDNVIESLISNIQIRDPYTASHQKRVGALCEAIAKKMEFPEDRIKCLVCAAENHDIGKILTPLELLAKKETLNNVDIIELKNHVQVGHDILCKIEFSCPVAEIVLQHHELIDGSGYPNNLAGDEILLDSKILTVADVMDAVTSNRPYRDGRGVEKGLQELHKYKEIYYDGQVVDICTKLFKEENYRFDYNM